MDERLLIMMSAFLKQIEPHSKVQPSDLSYFPLKSGNSSATLYRFDLAMKSYVIRLLPPQANQQTRMHQIHLASTAGKIGVGPEIVFLDPLLEGFIMDFIPGRTAQQKDFSSNDQLAKFARFLQKLHRSKEQFPVAPSPFQRFNDFCLKGEQLHITYPTRFSDVKAIMKVLEAIFQQKLFPLVPTHLDLHPLNIMVTEDQFTLVDWVNRGMSDPTLT